MREIKFRAWEKTSESMVYDVQNVSRKRIIGESACESFQEVIDSWEYEVMQYTGLKDKNGKEIYEGDILRHPPKNEWEEKNFVAFEVFYHDNNNADNHVGFQMNRLHFHGAYAGYYMTEKFLPRYTEGMIVIGNVFENPELVAKKNE